MVERFARGLESVVTGSAAASDSGMVHERNRRPRGRRMTIDTRTGCDHMVRWLLCCLDYTGSRVTALAVRVGGLEHAAGMACFTGNIQVRAIQFESGAEMIEGLLGGKLLSRQ